MTTCIIRDYSISCGVNLPGKFFQLLKFVLYLIPIAVVLVFYFYSLSDLRDGRSFISFFSVCVMFACICGFILEHVTVAVVSGCFSHNITTGDIDEIYDLVVDFKFFERTLGAVFVVFFVVFKLSA